MTNVTFVVDDPKALMKYYSILFNLPTNASVQNLQQIGLNLTKKGI